LLVVAAVSGIGLRRSILSVASFALLAIAATV
jgi:hypothetical protein